MFRTLRTCCLLRVTSRGMHVGRVCRGWRNIGSEFGIALSHTQELLEFIFSFNSALDSGRCSQRVLDLLSVLIGGKFTWVVFVFESVVLCHPCWCWPSAADSMKHTLAVSPLQLAIRCD